MIVEDFTKMHVKTEAMKKERNHEEDLF